MFLTSAVYCEVINSESRITELTELYPGDTSPQCWSDNFESADLLNHTQKLINLKMNIYGRAIDLTDVSTLINVIFGLMMIKNDAK